MKILVKWKKMNNTILYDFMIIIRFLVLITGFVDAIKYRVETSKIKRTKSSRDISRKFTLMAIVCDIILLVYVVLIKEPTLFIVRLMSLFFMIELFWNQYIHYPYKLRNVYNFRRPNFFVFLWNACLPNKKRKRL